MPPLRTPGGWGGIVLGAMAGLGLALAVFLVLAATGIIDGTERLTILIFVQFLSLFVAGYVAGRLTTTSGPLAGGLAGLLVFFVTVALSVAGGSSVGVASLLLLGVTAAVLGSAGGVLAQFVRER